METSQYKGLFISESREILAKLNKSLVELEKKPQDSELLNEIFRQSHTLKGMAASMGYEDIVKPSHAMESVLDLLRNHRLSVEKDIVSALFEAFDLLESLIEGVDRKKDSADWPEDKSLKLLIAGVVNKLDEISSKTAAPQKSKFKEKRMLRLEEEDRIAIARAAKEGILTYRVTVTLAKKCKMREARAFMVLKSLGESGKILKEDYIGNQIKSGRFGRHFGSFFMTKEDPLYIKEKIKAIAELEKIDLKLLEVDEVLIPDPVRGTATPIPSFGATGQATASGAICLSKRGEAQTVRVPVERLDSLMNIAGEFVINKNRLFNVGLSLEDKSLTEALTQMGRLTSDLQTEMMMARLVPMAYLFDRFPRMVRDLAREEGKEIDLEIEGADIGLDRTILDEINDPLIHLLRNAVSHGVEEPEEREKRGKSRTGRIRLMARKERNFVEIQVSDDGMGMDVDEIRKIAIDKKMVNEEGAFKLSSQDVMMLITTAGFSTSKKVTETSGRGVGMNTVRTKVESFGGSLAIETKPNEGSKFILKLPVSMAILQALLVKVASEIYAIPLANIAETMKVEKSIIKTMEHHEVVPYRDEVLPLIRLKEKFGFAGEPVSLRVPPRRGEAISTRLPLVVVEIGSKKAGLVVDELVGQQEVVIKTLAGDLKGMKGVAGATIMGDGRVALIVDISSII